MKESLKVQLQGKLINVHGSVGRNIDIMFLRHWVHPWPRWTYWLWDHKAISICLFFSVGVCGGGVLGAYLFRPGKFLPSMFPWTGDPTFFDLGSFCPRCSLGPAVRLFSTWEFLALDGPPGPVVRLFSTWEFLALRTGVFFFARHPSKTKKTTSQHDPNMTSNMTPTWHPT